MLPTLSRTCLIMEYLGRTLETVLGPNGTTHTLHSRPWRRSESEPGEAEEARESRMFFSIPSGWVDLGQASTSEDPSPRGLRLPWASDGEEEPDHSKPGVKGRIKRYLNDVRYGVRWPRRAESWDEDAPIWLLGKFYHSRTVVAEPTSPSIPDADILTQVESIIQDFRHDFHSKIWLTYRKGFPVFEGSHATSDTGWGCMLRSGQMILAQALVLHLLGREWSLYEPQSQESIRDHRRIIAYFGDSPACPLSIHNLVEEGARKHGKTVGDWHGPGSVALVFRDLFASPVVTTDPVLSQLAIYVARDCAVYLNEIDEMCSKSVGVGLPPKRPVAYQFTESSSPYDSFVKVEKVTHLGSASDDASPPAVEWRRALVLLVPLRLGTSFLNPSYSAHLRTLLSLRNCLGLIGGKPKHSMYFVGVHKDSLVYLDPHLAQEYFAYLRTLLSFRNCLGLIGGKPKPSMYFVGVHKDSLVYLDPHLAQEYEDTTLPGFSIKSFHCHTPRKLEIGELDPSCAVGFYARTREEFHQLLEDLKQVIDMEGGPSSALRQPLFSVLSRPRSPTLPARHSPAARRAARHHGFELL